MTDTANPTTKMAAELVECGDKIDTLNEQVRKLNLEYDIREKQLIERYELEKVDGVIVEVNGIKRSVSPSKRFWAKKKEGEAFTPEQVYDALIADGLQGFAKKTYDMKTLTSYFNELLKEEGASIPPNLAKYIDAKEYSSISIRKK